MPPFIVTTTSPLSETKAFVGSIFGFSGQRHCSRRGAAPREETISWGSWWEAPYLSSATNFLLSENASKLGHCRKPYPLAIGMITKKQNQENNSVLSPVRPASPRNGNGASVTSEKIIAT